MRFAISKAIAIMAAAGLAVGVPGRKKNTDRPYEIQPGINDKGRVIAPAYCLPPEFTKSWKPTFSFHDFSKDRKDIYVLEKFVPLYANHSDYTDLEYGIWEVLNGTFYTEKAGEADPKWVVHGWVAVLKFVELHALKGSGVVGQFIFHRGNETIGEEKIVIGRKGYYKTKIGFED